jgi:hypothetical protein
MFCNIPVCGDRHFLSPVAMEAIDFCLQQFASGWMFPRAQRATPNDLSAPQLDGFGDRQRRVYRKSLLDAGERVVILDNLSTGFDWAVAQGAALVVGDAGDNRLVANLQSGRFSRPGSRGRLRIILRWRNRS